MKKFFQLSFSVISILLILSPCFAEAAEEVKCGEGDIEIGVKNFIDAKSNLRLRIVEASSLRVKDEGQDNSLAQALDSNTVVSGKAFCIGDLYCIAQQVLPNRKTKFEFYRIANPGSKGTQSNIYERKKLKTSPSDSKPVWAISKDRKVTVEPSTNSLEVRYSSGASFQIHVNDSKISISTGERSGPGALDISLSQEKGKLATASALEFDRELPLAYLKQENDKTLFEAKYEREQAEKAGGKLSTAKNAKAPKELERPETRNIACYGGNMKSAVGRGGSPAPSAPKR